MKKGFTIVELMMVVGIIAVLMGIVTTAASTSIKMARNQKANALCRLVQTGLETYYARSGEWPSAMPVNRATENGETYVLLSDDETRKCVQELVECTKKGSPVMDITGLFVSSSVGSKAIGVDFMQAATIKGMKTAQSKMRQMTGGKRLTVSQMYFGYPESSHGYFRPFKILYYPASDTVTVSKQ